MIKIQTKNLHQALTDKNKKLFKKVPHTDLHCHGILSAPFSALKQISPKIKLPPKYFDNIIDFNLYLRNNIAPVVRDLETVRCLIKKSFSRLIKEGVVYSEMSFDLTIPEHLGVSLEDYLAVIAEEKERVSNKLKVCLEVGFDRDISPKKLLILFKKALKNNIFGSIDLYGNEGSRSIEDFIPIYKLADKHNLKLKAHIGEFGTAQDIKETVQKLNLQVVQHGIAASQNEDVMKFLAENKIYLNICPESNLALKVVDCLSEHPIRRLFDNEVLVTVNSDDFSIFNKSVGQQLIDLYATNLFSEKEIAQIIDNGLKQPQYVN